MNNTEIKFSPRMIYQYVGLLCEDHEYVIVTRQCASIAAAAREAIKYADKHGMDRSSMRICQLVELDVKVEKFNPYIDERLVK